MRWLVVIGLTGIVRKVQQQIKTTETIAMRLQKQIAIV